MAFLVKDDLKTHLYGEIVAEITRDDDTIIDRGISAGTGEVKSYLSRYDLAILFDGSLADEIIGHLRNLTKDVVCWNIIKLSNPNIDLKLFRTSYEDAIAFLTKVQKGQADPDGWPYKADDPATKGNENDTVQWGSNPKRRQHF